MTTTRHKQNASKAALKKLKLKALFVSLSFFIMLMLPLFYDKHLPFNTLFHITVDFPRIPSFSVFYPIMVVIFLYLSYLVFRANRYARLLGSISPETINVTRRRFDFIALATHLFAVYMILNAFFLSFATVSGTSMEPTFEEGDAVVVQHFAAEYERFDLVVAGSPDFNEEEFYIKRIVGLPGEEVTIQNGDVLIDEEPVEEAFLSEDIKTTCPGGSLRCTFTPGPGEYFLMGDNRAPGASKDSRTLGAFSRDNLYGRVTFRFRPIRDMGSVE